MTTQPTRGARVAADITSLLRARNTLLWVVSREEARVESALTESAAKATYAIRFWDCANGIVDAKGEQVGEDRQRDPSEALALIKRDKTRCVYVMRDLHKWLDPMVLRGVRSLARELQSVSSKSECRAIVVLSPSAEVPPELAGHTIVVDYPLPDRGEIAAVLDEVLATVASELPPMAPDVYEAAIDAAVGLSALEAENCYARSLVLSRKVDPSLVSGEKKRVIAREKVLTWHDPDPRGLDAIGGLDVLKRWLTQRRTAFSPAAKAYGLEAPKGAMLVGVPGCGKSLTAKAVASAWGMPLLRLDMGALRSKWVGESEANIRKALQVAETVSPCVLWLDEIEKALGGSTGPQGDGGVAADALGAVLSWMQERQGAVFVIATANDVRSLPPELLRKGRFDEVFWVDLPTARERELILFAEARKADARSEKDLDGQAVDFKKVALACEEFTGAEMAAIVPDAMFAAFADGERRVTTQDLLDAAKTVVPLAKTASDKIQALREWAKGRARPASTPETTTNASAKRSIDL